MLLNIVAALYTAITPYATQFPYQTTKQPPLIERIADNKFDCARSPESKGERYIPSTRTLSYSDGPVNFRKEVEKVFPRQEWLKVVRIFDDHAKEDRLITLFLSYGGDDSWDVAVNYLSKTKEPMSVYFARGVITFVEGFTILTQPDILFRLKPNKEVFHEKYNIRNLVELVDRMVYFCSDNLREGYQSDFNRRKSPKEKQKKIAPPRKPKNEKLRKPVYPPIRKFAMPIRR